MENPNLTNDSGEAIARLFSLGKLESIAPIKGGLWNYNYEIKTDKGEFIARFSSFELDEEKIKRLEMQFKTLFYLRENNFEYAVPLPLISTNKNYIEKIGKDSFWVYEKIKGIVRNKFAEIDLKEVATLVAKYHKIVKNMILPLNKDIFNSYESLEEDILEIKRRLKDLKDKNEADFLISDNLELIEKALKRISKIDFGNDRLIAHSDWYAGNFVIEKGKIIGLLDLDLYEIAPSIKDVALAIHLYCFTEDHKMDKNSANKFLEYYNQIIPLNEKDVGLIEDLIIRECIFATVFFYAKMKKDDFGKRNFLLKWVTESIKNLMNELEKENYLSNKKEVKLR